MKVAALLGLAALSRVAYADDGYCDFVENTASAVAAPELAPKLIGLFGYVEQAPTDITPTQLSTLRLIAGVDFRLTGIYEGIATKDRARADCERHQALDDLRGQAEARAVSARASALDDELTEAKGILEIVQADFDAHRATAQEALATRLRVEELLGLADAAHRQLTMLPAPTDQPLTVALATYAHADADMESAEARLRRAQLVDVSVRAGVDEFLNSSAASSTPYFAVVQVGVSIGALWQGGANQRAAAARHRFVQSGHDQPGLDTALARVKETIDVERKRVDEITALVGDLERQLTSLGKIPGEDSKRYRQTVWFDYAKAKAELAYLTAHIASLRPILGSSP